MFVRLFFPGIGSAVKELICLLLFFGVLNGSVVNALEMSKADSSLAKEDAEFLGFMSAGKGKFSKVATRLLQTNDPNSKIEEFYWMTLFQMVVSGPQDNESIALIECMIRMGASLDQQDAAGRYPIENALRRNNYELVRVLVSAGANINMDDVGPRNEGKTLLAIALYEAVSRRDFRIAQLLADSGAKLRKSELIKIERKAQLRSSLEFSNFMAKYAAIIQLDGH